MADEKYVTASSFSLSGGSLGGTIAVKSFSGLEMNVEVSGTSAGNQVGAKRKLEPKPGPTKPGTPTFVCPIPKGDKKLATWWKKLNPNDKPGDYKPEDLTFSFIGGSGPVAEWQLKGVFPMKYQVSDADSDSSDLATETIQLCVTEINREK
ncbi:phage tail protein [Nostoc sp.]|uniref:phage tail protein n=1 Tax=Nostoc sp. TaxID=1180 RepID=UPI002FF511FA